jgi:predicted DNA-binding transcriptional regulator AlpA
VLCACGCESEFEPERRNQIYLNAEHRQKDKNRRWPPKRHPSLPVLSRNGLGERQQAQTSGVTPLLGSEMAQTIKRALQAQKRRKAAPEGGRAGLLTCFQVARLLGVSWYCLYEWRKAGCGPPYLRISHGVLRYPRNALESWLRSRLQVSRGENFKRARSRRRHRPPPLPFSADQQPRLVESLSPKPEDV